MMTMIRNLNLKNGRRIKKWGQKSGIEIFWEEISGKMQSRGTSMAVWTILAKDYEAHERFFLQDAK